VRYVKSSIGLQRLVHTKMISDVAVEVGLERTKESLIPLFADLSVDPEPAVRQRLVEQLTPLAQVITMHFNTHIYRISIKLWAISFLSMWVMKMPTVWLSILSFRSRHSFWRTKSSRYSMKITIHFVINLEALDINYTTSHTSGSTICK
jgi:hypothetical protein